MNNEIMKPGGSAIARESFGGKEVERRGETASSALVAQARAEIEARYVMALQRPRNPDNVRVRLLGECERPSFAEAAIYSLPKGDKPGRLTGRPGRIEGLTIRFAETAFRISGNLDRSSRVLYDDEDKRLVRVTVVDLETNAAQSADIVVSKTVERRKLGKGQVAIAERANSSGETVYLVAASDDELLQKQNNLSARAARTILVSLVDVGTIQECENKIVDTLGKEDAKDPAEARKRLLDAFAKLGILPSQLEEYLGNPIAACTPPQLIDLRGLYAALRDGETTWADTLAEVLEQRGERAKPKAEDLEDKLRKSVDAAKKGKAASNEKPKPEAGPKTAEQVTKAQEKPNCVICGKPIEGEPKATWDKDGAEAFRHPTCSAFTANDGDDLGGRQ